MNYYAEAIEICSKEQDWKKIVIEIARKHPKAVVRAAAAPDESWEPQARCLYLIDNNKIAAIKHCRAMTGMALIEAKEAVEALK